VSGDVREVPSPNLPELELPEPTVQRLPMSLIARLAVCISAGTAFNFVSFVILGLTWGLIGPAWESSPPDMAASVLEVSLTGLCALAGFWVCWFLIRVDRRDWWLGAGVASPWIAGAAAIAISYGLDSSSMPVVAGLFLCAAFPVAGSMLQILPCPPSS